MASLEDFDRYCEEHNVQLDRYCEEHNVQPGEYGEAFALWLSQQTGSRRRAGS
jgi:hypothetical protein